MKLGLLKVDFAPAAASPVIGILMLVIALALAADAGLAWRSARAEAARLDGSTARVVPSGRAARIAPEELAAARETLARLSTPWGRLFEAIETSRSAKVALLSIEPDPKARTVLITAEGQDYLAALNYVMDLRRAGALTRVHLVKHEQRPGGPRPLAFSVAASWGDAPAVAGNATEPGAPAETPVARTTPDAPVGGNKANDPDNGRNS